jgi:hypothetical protein
MENLKIRCKTCNREIEGHPTKTVACGCSNMATVRVNTYVSALDLSKVVMLNSIKSKEETSLFTNEDIAWQEARRQRKVRRLDFEVR